MLTFTLKYRIFAPTFFGPPNHPEGAYAEPG